jgi:hypothetical protein
MSISLHFYEDNYNDNDYDYETYSIKELHKICDYYGITKISKYKKIELVNIILVFENDDNNNYIVSKRKIMWALMDQLNNDTKMRKYMLWK